ncbi:MAG: hypothetical protein ACRDQ0_07895, partial [Pseudonocardia sp.]
MGEHVYDLIVAAILGGIAVLLAGAYAGLWVMRRRWLDTQRQLQREREERLRAVNELKVAVARTEYERQLAALDEEDDESPEERRSRIRLAPPPLAIPIALLAGAAAWLRTHLWTPAREHPWATVGGLGAAAAVTAVTAAVFIAPAPDDRRVTEPPISIAPTAPAPPTPDGST